MHVCCFSWLFGSPVGRGRRLCGMCKVGLDGDGGVAW